MNIGRLTPQPPQRGSFNLTCTLLPQESETTSYTICGFKCPLMFERASRRWWKPEFDSKILEGQFLKTSFLMVTIRFRFALAFIILASLSWAVYFSFFRYTNWIICVCFCILSTTFTISLLVFSFSKRYICHQSISILTTIMLCALSLTAFSGYYNRSHVDADLSATAIFSIYIEVILLIYTLIPLPLHVCFVICGLYSFVYELLYCLVVPQQAPALIGVRFFLHFCTHLIGSHILIMTEVRSRRTFLKVGHSLLVRRDLQIEKQLKEKMIHSVMPPQVANWLLSTRKESDENNAGIQENIQLGGRKSMHDILGHNLNSHPSSKNIFSVFRPFNMHRMENVSILYADIVGFTKMSSNKTAEQLVGLLNDLFGRFDHLCCENGCEKIATLGDCYYCVSGCPEPQLRHANCCVEMGLGMIKTIKEFDEDTNEQVDMRVGVHTGTVLCGIVGTCRFKFDVWSNDVCFANIMESTGKPGKVHISEVTFSFIEDNYFVEEGDFINGVKTYFITGQNTVLPLYVPPRESSPNRGDATSVDMPPKINILTSQDDFTKTPLHNESEEMRQEQTLMADDGNKIKPTLQNLPGQTVGSLSQSALNYINSRKDSGIRSDRSSLPDLTDESLQTGEMYGHRVSGYYTSSLPSLAEIHRTSLAVPPNFCDARSPYIRDSFSVDPSLTLNESLVRARNLRKQSDLQIIKCIQKDIVFAENLVKLPVSSLSLFFLDPHMEQQYRKFAYKFDRSSQVPFMAFNLYYDVFISACVFFIVSISCFILFNRPALWVIIFILAELFQLGIIILCVNNHVPFKIVAVNEHLHKIFIALCTHWSSWHVCGGILVFIPLLSVFTNFNCAGTLSTDGENSSYFFQLTFIGLIHFCNFTQLNCWMKSILCTVAMTIPLLLYGYPLCSCDVSDAFVSFSNEDTTFNVSTQSNTTIILLQYSFFCNDKLYYELVISTLLLLCLVWILNREFEISSRFCFLGNRLAVKDEFEIEMMKDQAEKLLHSIIPKHVAEQLKCTSKYSENHKNVGVIFASITNFNTLYDESFEGGH